MSILSLFKKLLMAAPAVGIALGAVVSAEAATIVTGNIVPVFDDTGTRIGNTVDRYSFTVNSPGTVTIDTLSWEVDSEDRFDRDGDFNETVDVNGDGEIAFFDPYIYLFNDDGALDVSDFINANDDAFSSTYGDGSIYGFDSYLSELLNPGNYVLAIGSFFLSAEDAVAGINLGANFYPVTSDGMGNLSPIDHGDYQITFTGDVDDVKAVPEPVSVLGLLGLGVLGTGSALKRKKENV